MTKAGLKHEDTKDTKKHEEDSVYRRLVRGPGQRQTAEVHQQPNSIARRLQIRKNLSVVNDSRALTAFSSTTTEPSTTRSIRWMPTGCSRYRTTTDFSVSNGIVANRIRHRAHFDRQTRRSRDQERRWTVMAAIDDSLRPVASVVLV